MFIFCYSHWGESSRASYESYYVVKPRLCHQGNSAPCILLSCSDFTHSYIITLLLFRFCPEKYYPFDPKVINKYVVTDDYMAPWDVPSMAKYYTDQEVTRKQALFHVLDDFSKSHNRQD